MTNAIPLEKTVETAEQEGIYALCRRLCEQAHAAVLAAGAPSGAAEKPTMAKESALSYGRMVVLTESVYAREFLDAFSADGGAASKLRVAMSAQRRPCYRNKDIVPAFYLPGTPQAEREKQKLPVIDVQEAMEHALRLLSLLFQTLDRQGACPKRAAADVRLLALYVHAPAAVTGLGLCRVLTGKTQRELAALLGVGVKTYRLREQGRMPLSKEMAIAVCRMAGCRSDILLSGENVGWNAAAHIWKLLSADTRRRIAVCTALFVRTLYSMNADAKEDSEQ